MLFESIFGFIDFILCHINPRGSFAKILPRKIELTDDICCETSAIDRLIESASNFAAIIL